MILLLTTTILAVHVNSQLCSLRDMKEHAMNACDNLARKIRSPDSHELDPAVYSYKVFNETESECFTLHGGSLDFNAGRETDCDLGVIEDFFSHRASAYLHNLLVIATVTLSSCMPQTPHDLCKFETICKI